VLIGQNELDAKLRTKEMRQLRQRINVHRTLPPMSPPETIEYMDYRLKIAGSTFDSCFTPGCRKQIYEMTGGVPRSINRLCDNALLICMVEKRDKVTPGILDKALHVINNDTSPAPKEGLSDAFSYAKMFKLRFAAAAVILVVTLGYLGLLNNLGQRFKGWVYGSDARQEASATVGKYQLPGREAKGRDNPPSGVGENSSPGSPPAPTDSPALDSKQKSLDAVPQEDLTGKKTGENVTAKESVSSPGGEASSSPPPPEETKDRTADNNPVPAQPAGEGAEQLLAEENATEDVVPEGPQKDSAPKELPGESVVMAYVDKTAETAPVQGARDGAVSADAEKADKNIAPQEIRDGASKEPGFFVLTARKGESLSQIALRFFPKNPKSGLESILAANPQIRDRNLILVGQTLKIPKTEQ